MIPKETWKEGRYTIIVHAWRGNSGRDFVHWEIKPDLVTLPRVKGYSPTIKQARVHASQVARVLPFGTTINEDNND